MGDLNGRWQSDPVMAKSGNGALEIFGIGTDGALWHQGQTAPNSPWSGNWQRFPDEFYREPAIFDPLTSRPSVLLQNGRFWVFMRSARGRILYIRHDPARTSFLPRWSEWKTIGGIVEGGDPVVGNPVAVVRDYLIEVFARGRNGDLCRKTQRTIGSDDWSDWTSLGGVLSSDPCPTSIQEETRRQDLVFARGLDQRIWVTGRIFRRSAVNVVSVLREIDWTALGCPQPGALLSGNPVPSGSSVTWRGIDGVFWSKAQTRNEPGVYEGSCQRLDFPMAGDPVTCFHADNGHETFWRSPDGALMRRFRTSTGAFTGPERITDGLLGQPVVNTSQNDRMEVIFRRGSTGELFHMFQMTPYGNFLS